MVTSNMYYSIVIKIPSLNEDWNFKSITTLQQKEICKSLLLDNNTILLNTLNKVLNQCLDPINSINSLTLTDKIVILLKLRWESIGDTIEILVEKEGKKYNSIFNLAETTEKFTKIYSSIKPHTIEEKKFKIVCNVPGINKEIDFITQISEENVSYNDILPYFINFISIDNQQFILTQKELHTILTYLPVNLYEQIISYVKETINTMHSVLIYSYFEEEIFFNYSRVYIDFIKFFLKEDLYSIYQDIYLLNKVASFNSDYIENMSPLERQLYITFIMQERQQTTTGPSTNNPSSNSIPNNASVDTFDSFMNEMGG